MTTNVGGVRRAASPIEEFLSSQDPVWVWDAENGRVAWANAAGAAFWGEENFESLRMRRFDVKTPGVARMDALARNRSGKSQWIEALELPTAEGGKGRVCCLQRLQLAGGERGVIVRVLSDGNGAGRSIGAGEKIARKSGDKPPAGFASAAAAPLRAMAEALGGYVLLDEGGLVVFASKQARHFLGRENADLTGTDFSALFLGARAQIERAVSRASAAAASDKTRGALRPSRLEGLLLRAGEELSPCRALFTPVQGSGGVCVSLCDLRPGKALQRRLDAQRKKVVDK